MLVAGLCLTAVAGSDVSAREPAPVVVKEIVRTMKNDVGQAITVPSGHLQLVVSTYDIAPGARLPQHKHPFERTGASVMGKRMFDLGENAWPEEAPFHTPAFVVTHEKRDPWERPGGTTFHFVNDGIETALDQARRAVGD
jgi:hypothetical protein